MPEVLAEMARLIDRGMKIQGRVLLDLSEVTLMGLYGTPVSSPDAYRKEGVQPVTAADI